MQIDKHRNRDDVEVVVELELLPDASEDDAAAETTAVDADVAAATKKAVESIEDEVVWWRDVNVRAAIASQVGCTAVVLCGAEMTPLWMATSVANGGLGWTSLEIGAFGTVMGCVILLFQVFLFTRLCRAYGIVTLLTYALLVNAVAFPLHPIAHVAAKKVQGVDMGRRRLPRSRAWDERSDHHGREFADFEQRLTQGHAGRGEWL